MTILVGSNTGYATAVAYPTTSVWKSYINGDAGNPQLKTATAGTAAKLGIAIADWGAQTGIRAGVYNGADNALLGQATVTPAAGVGNVLVDLAAPITLTDGQTLFVAFWQENDAATTDLQLLTDNSGQQRTTSTGGQYSAIADPYPSSTGWVADGVAFGWWLEDAQTADTTPPTLSNPTLTVNSNTAVTFGATSNEDGTAHAVVRLASDPAATQQEIVDGTYANAVAVPADVAITANTAYQFAQVTGLTGNTAYAVDQVATDAAGNISSVNTQTFTTQSAEVQVTISGGANLTGLDYVLFNSQDLATAGILKQGAGESTDASGNLVIDVNDVSVTDGQAVYYVIGDTGDTQIAGGPATVSIA